MVARPAREQTVERHAVAQLRRVYVHRGFVFQSVSASNGVICFRRIGSIEVIPRVVVPEAQETHGSLDLGREDEGADALWGPWQRPPSYQSVVLFIVIAYCEDHGDDGPQIKRGTRRPPSRLRSSPSAAGAGVHSQTARPT